MSIATNLQRLVTAKSDIADAITAKGGTVNQGDGFEEFPADIATIPEGGIDFFNVRCVLRAIPRPKTIDLTVSYDIDSIMAVSWVTSGSSITNLNGADIWSDGSNIYYSHGVTQYVLDKSTAMWNTKTWSGLTSFNGENIWSDGNDIYYSAGSTYISYQYVLDKTTSTWTAKTWSGFTDIHGSSIWSDGNRR